MPQEAPPGNCYPAPVVWSGPSGEGRRTATTEEAAVRYERALLYARLFHGGLHSLASELQRVSADDIEDPTLCQRHMRLAAYLVGAADADGDDRQRVLQEVEDPAARLRLLADSPPNHEIGAG